MAASSSSSLGIMRRASETMFCPHRGGQSFLHLHRPPLLPMAPNHNQIVRRACLVSNLNNCRVVENSVSPFPFDDDQKQKQLDDWMSYSVSEIVRNIGDAPLLMHVYSNSKDDDDEEEERVESSSLASTTTPTTPPRIEREIDVAVGTESWSHIRRRWEEGSPVPDGVILVEQLDHNNKNNNNIPSTEEEEEKEKEDQPQQQQQVIGEANYSCSNNNNNKSTTKTWGVLVQGRGTDSTPACYILKTCRVWSSLGFCTHFCLVRAKCFGEVAELQLNDSWLQPH